MNDATHFRWGSTWNIDFFLQFSWNLPFHQSSAQNSCDIAVYWWVHGICTLQWLIIVNYSVVPSPSLMYWKNWVFVTAQVYNTLHNLTTPQVRFGTRLLFGFGGRINVLGSCWFASSGSKHVRDHLLFRHHIQVLKICFKKIWGNHIHPAKTLPQQNKKPLLKLYFLGLMMDVLFGMLFFLRCKHPIIIKPRHLRWWRRFLKSQPVGTYTRDKNSWFAGGGDMFFPRWWVLFIEMFGFNIWAKFENRVDSIDINMVYIYKYTNQYMSSQLEWRRNFCQVGLLRTVGGKQFRSARFKFKWGKKGGSAWKWALLI